MKATCVNVFGECRYTVGCEFGCIAARQQMQFAPSPPSPYGAREVKPLTEDDVRRIVREEIAQAMAVHLLRPHADPANPVLSQGTTT